MKYRVCGLGAKYGGKCVVCGQDTGSRSWELAKTALLKSEAGKFAVAHGNCIGETKSAVGGGVKWRKEPQSEIEVV